MEGFVRIEETKEKKQISSDFLRRSAAVCADSFLPWANQPDQQQFHHPFNLKRIWHKGPGITDLYHENLLFVSVQQKKTHKVRHHSLRKCRNDSLSFFLRRKNTYLLHI